MRNLPHRVGKSADATCCTDWTLTTTLYRDARNQALLAVGIEQRVRILLRAQHPSREPVATLVVRHAVALILTEALRPPIRQVTRLWTLIGASALKGRGFTGCGKSMIQAGFGEGPTSVGPLSLSNAALGGFIEGTNDVWGAPVNGQPVGALQIFLD